MEVVLTYLDLFLFSADSSRPHDAHSRSVRGVPLGALGDRRKGTRHQPRRTQGTSKGSSKGSSKGTSRGAGVDRVGRGRSGVDQRQL